MTSSRLLYVTACQEAKGLRETHLKSLDEARAVSNHTSVDSERTKRLTIQSQKEAGRALSMMKQKARPRASKVYITHNGVWHVCTTKESIEWACITENTKRFTQVYSTPPMDNTIVDWIGLNADSSVADGILQGRQDLSSIRDYFLRLVLESMRCPQTILDKGPILDTIFLQEHISGWKKQKRITSSEWSQLQFNDHKAAAFNKRMADLDRQFQ